MNERNTPPPIQMLETSLPPDYEDVVRRLNSQHHQFDLSSPPPDYDTAVNGVNSPDQQREPPPAYRTHTANRPPGLATSDSATPYLINVDQQSRLSRTDPVVSSQANPALSPTSNRTRSVNQLSELARSDPGPQSFIGSIEQPSGFSRTNHRYRVHAGQPSRTAEVIDADGRSHISSSTLVTWAMVFSVIMLFIAVLFGIFPLICACKADHYLDLNPKKSRRCAIASLIGSTLTLVGCVLLITLCIHFDQATTTNWRSNTQRSCPYSKYYANGLCYTNKDCWASSSYCVYSYLGYYDSDDCCYYDTNLTSTTPTSTIRTSQTTNPCPNSKYYAGGSCFTNKFCWPSSLSCADAYHGYYASDYCCYYDNNPTSTTPRPTTIQTSQTTNPCPSSKFYADGSCYTNKNCGTSYLACANVYYGNYASDGCCYYNINPTSTTPTTIRTSQTTNPCPYSGGLCYPNKMCGTDSYVCRVIYQGYFTTNGCCYLYPVYTTPSTTSTTPTRNA